MKSWQGSKNVAYAKSQNSVLLFFSSLTKYLALRARQFTIVNYITFVWVSTVYSYIKAKVVQGMFWGRRSFYRTAFHSLISIMTISAVLSGITSRLNQSSANENGLELGDGITGRSDLFSQSGIKDTLEGYDEGFVDYLEYKYIVQQGDTISKISKLYGIGENTIRWANKISGNNLQTGQVLRIPEIDGVFVTVVASDTFDSLAKKYKASAQEIIDLNSNIIDWREPKLSQGMEIFIPNGIIITPSLPSTGRKYKQALADPGGVDVPPGTFVHPLGTDPNCAGWKYRRGISDGHSGVDLAKRGECWINSIGSGTVKFAGYYGGKAAYTVIIDHGNGFTSHYYHGLNIYAVAKGDTVKAGQKIMRLGNSGNSTGPHLHLSLFYNGKLVDPEKYVKIR